MKKLLVILIALGLAGYSGYIVYSMLGGYSGVLPHPITPNTDTSVTNDSMMTSSETDIASSNASSDTGTLMSASSSSASVLAASSSSETMHTNTAVYAAYSDGVIGNGDVSVIFFHDKTSSSSKASDASLKSMYKLGTPNITTYLVNFDATGAVEKKYGVTQGDTFLLIDGRGVLLKTVTDPSSDDLQALLQ